MPPPTLASRARTLSSVPLLAGLPQDTLRSVADVATVFDVPAGHVLIEAGSPGSGMFVIEEGTVVVQARGRRRRELGPGEAVGELALLTSAGVRTARVQATTPVRCLAVARDDFRRLLLAEPALAVALLEIVATRLAQEIAPIR